MSVRRLDQRYSGRELLARLLSRCGVSELEPEAQLETYQRPTQCLSKATGQSGLYRRHSRRRPIGLTIVHLLIRAGQSKVLL